MKKTWILTPLLLGIGIWGCSGSNVGSQVEAPPGAEVSRSGSSVDEQLTRVPLEEMEESRPADYQNIEFSSEPSSPNIGYRPNSVMERAKEAEAGRFQFGEGVNSDAGVTGSVVVDERQSNGKAQQQRQRGRTSEAKKEADVKDRLAPSAMSLDGMEGGYGGYGEGMGGGYGATDGSTPATSPGSGGYGGGYGMYSGGATPKPTSDPAGGRGYGGGGYSIGADYGATVDSGYGMPAVNNPVPAREPEGLILRNRSSGEAAEKAASTRSVQDAERAQKLDGNTIPAIGGLVDQPGSGLGPGEGGDKFDLIEENDFIAVDDQPLSTFSIDVDTASYSKIRSYLSQFGQLPPRDAVRVEELVNYFQYDYAQPTDEHPFAANVEVASCPWNPSNRLVRVGIKGKEVDTQDRPASNIVFLLDVSGSMNSPNKLPLLKKGMKMLVDQLGENDKVSIVVYAGAAGMVLEPTYGYDKAKILSALDRLQAGGSTNGGQGIQLAYKTATENFITGGTNRVILCTDGDFNVGETSTGGLVEMAAAEAKKNIYMSILGFGIGNHNDSMLEQLSNKANGNYAFIDNDKEAQKVLVEQMSGTLLTIAKDVKIQIEFNPQKVASYRLVGYENRLLAAQDFNDDKKDAGEIGAGHTVTAFYEIVPVQAEEQIASVDPMVDELKYQTERKPTEAAQSDELMTLKLRYKQPESDVSTLMTYPVVDEGHQFNQSTGDFQFASAVAMFGLKLRSSQFHSDTNFAEIEELVASNVDGPGSSYREEFLELVRKAESAPK